jgi:hypothetical protein
LLFPHPKTPPIFHISIRVSSNLCHIGFPIWDKQANPIIAELTCSAGRPQPWGRPRFPVPGYS